MITSSTQTPTADEIRQQPQVRSANVWQDRIYINVRGNGANWRGEQTSKIWLRGNRLTVEMGRGLCSSDWHANLKSLRAWLASRSVEG